MIRTSVLAVTLRAIGSALSLAVVALSVRLYDSDDSNSIIFYLSFLNFGSVFLRFGLDIAFVNLSRGTYRLHNRRLLSALWLLTLAQSILVLIPFAAVLIVLGDLAPSTAAAAFVGLVFFSLLFGNGLAFQSQGYFTWMLFCRSFFINIPLLMLVWLQVDLVVLVFSHAFVMASSFVLSCCTLNRRILTGRWARPRRVLRTTVRLYRVGAPLFVSALAASFRNWGVVFFVQIPLQGQPFEAFVVSQRISQTAAFFLGSIQIVATPQMVTLIHERRFAELRKFIVKFRIATVSYSLAILLVVASSLGMIASFVKIDSAMLSAPVYIMLFAQIVSSAVGPVNPLLVMLRQHVFLRNMAVVTLPLMLIAIFFAALAFGTVGAATAFAVVIVGQNAAALLRSSRSLRLSENRER